MEDVRQTVHLVVLTGTAEKNRAVRKRASACFFFVSGWCAAGVLIFHCPDPLVVGLVAVGSYAIGASVSENDHG